MEYEKFKLIIELLEQVRERSHSIYKLGIDLMDYDEPNHKIISTLMESVFKEEGKEWIDWYLYERPGFNGKTNLATDENGNEICHNIESLWDTVKQHRKQ
jgi:hypothetical protein